jgi:hypothetical protein
VNDRPEVGGIRHEPAILDQGGIVFADAVVAGDVHAGDLADQCFEAFIVCGVYIGILSIVLTIEVGQGGRSRPAGGPRRASA